MCHSNKDITVHIDWLECLMLLLGHRKWSLCGHSSPLGTATKIYPVRTCNRLRTCYYVFCNKKSYPVLTCNPREPGTDVMEHEDLHCTQSEPVTVCEPVIMYCVARSLTQSEHVTPREPWIDVMDTKTYPVQTCNPTQTLNWCYGHEDLPSPNL